MHCAPLFITSLLGVSLVSSSGQAYDYTEHAHFSARAIARLIEEDPTNRALLAGVDAILDSELLCRGDALFMEAPENCFSLADLSGLAGDHAASPPLLVWRWFDDEAKSRAQRFRLFELLANTGAWVEAPDDAALRIPARARFLTYVRKFAPRHWPIVRPSDTKLLEFDDSYMNVILRMSSHFRPPVKDSFEDELPQFLSQRHAGKPAPQAFAFYADMHLGALTFAALAKQADDPRYLATAVVLELAAIHYLQDAVAPGHITANAAMGPASTSLTHDRDNAEGVLVGVPLGLCEGLGKPAGMLAVSPLCSARNLLDREAKTFEHLACPDAPGLRTVPGSCSPMSFDALTDSDPADPDNPRRIIIYGDGVVASQGRIYGVPYELARAVDDWATSLSYMSLREVLLAARTGCEGDAFPCDYHPPTRRQVRTNEAFEDLMARRAKGDDGERYELIVAWWEGIGDKQKQRAARIRAAFAAKRFEGVRFVPQVGADNREYAPIERFSGHSITTRFGFLHAFGGRHTRFPDTWSQPIPETRVAYRVVAPRVPVILELGVDVANLRGDVHEGIATHLLFAAGWDFGNVVYAQGGLAFGWLWPTSGAMTPHFSGRWDIELGINVVDTNAAAFSVAWLVQGATNTASSPASAYAVAWA